MREAAAKVAHALHFRLDEIMEFEIADLKLWLDESLKILNEIYKPPIQ
ncbi:hypothetical protein [Dissulfurispira sp.]